MGGVKIICRYSPKNGIKAAVEVPSTYPGPNLPMLTSLCLNPPAAFHLVSINRGIKHDFPFINIRKVPRDLENVNE